MKRVILSFIFALLAMVVGALRPELVSMVNIQWVVIIGLALIIVSLIFNPITEYVEVEKLHIRELLPPNSFRYGIGFFFKGQTARFILSDGSSIDGEVSGRSDRAGTITFKIDDDRYQTIPQAHLMRIETTEANTPKALFGLDDGPLNVPRGC